MGEPSENQAVFRRVGSVECWVLTDPQTKQIAADFAGVFGCEDSTPQRIADEAGSGHNVADPRDRAESQSPSRLPKVKAHPPSVLRGQ